MLKFPEVALAVAVSLLATPVLAGSYGLGRSALPEEIAAWDLDVSPGGVGLPAGSGDVLTGEKVFAEKCAACHGDFAEGVDNWPKLAGGEGTLDHEDPVKTVGSYWPHLSTTWDYINRSMPFGDAQSLSTDEVYAITAYILYSNYLVEEDFTLSDENFAGIVLPNADGFIVDDRAETEYAIWSGEPCMENCKSDVKITMRARVLDVTPDAGSDDAAVQQVSAAEDPAEEAPVEQGTAPDPDLVAKGEKVFRKCKSCHQLGKGAKNRSGPILTGVVDRAAGTVEGFKYSKALQKAAKDGLVWDEESLRAFLSKPKTFLKGTKMSFAGIRKDSDMAAILAYLRSVPE